MGRAARSCRLGNSTRRSLPHSSMSSTRRTSPLPGPGARADSQQRRPRPDVGNHGTARPPRDVADPRAGGNGRGRSRRRPRMSRRAGRRGLAVVASGEGCEIVTAADGSPKPPRGRARSPGLLPVAVTIRPSQNDQQRPDEPVRREVAVRCRHVAGAPQCSKAPSRGSTPGACRPLIVRTRFPSRPGPGTWSPSRAWIRLMLLSRSERARAVNEGARPKGKVAGSRNPTTIRRAPTARKNADARSAPR